MVDSETRVPRTAAALGLLAVLILPALGCRPAPPPAPESTAISNAALDLELEAPPSGFAVAKNEGAQLELAPIGEGATGRMWVAVGEPSDFGIALIDVVNGQKEVFEALPGGEFSGSRKLVSPLGDAYYSRGRYDLEGLGRVEEVRVLAIHPRANRLLTLFYRYPIGEDSALRVGQALELLGLIRLAGDAAVPTPTG